MKCSSMNFARTLAMVVAAGLAVGFEARAQDGAVARQVAVANAMAAKSQPLDIKRITLYRSGVGSFERRGKVTDTSTVQLRFKTEQINDILKSMVVLDLGGGQIEGASYASKEPLQKRLASFGVDISDNPTLPALLGKLRGAAASVQTVDGAISGTILGVEYRDMAQGNAQQPVKVPFLNLVTGGGMRAVDLTKVNGVELMDKDLAGELNKALMALAEHRADRSKNVDLMFRGSGARDVVVNYIHEMPVWKTSYRLVLPDMGKDDGQVNMQGWAIVENPTDEDWNGVSLSLVSGRPVSFQMDLYEPLYVSRPFIPVPMVPGVAPRVYAEGDATVYAMKDMADRKADEMLAKRADMRSAGNRPAKPAAPTPALATTGGRMLAGAEADAPAVAPMSAEDMANYSARAAAAATEVGEVFQYQLKGAVTIERQRSAMLPIIAEPVKGRRVSIYNAADSVEYPMRGVEVVNSTSLQLLPGPVSVFDGGAYAGDAQIGHVVPGDKRLLAYSVDLDVKASIKDESSSNVRRLKIVRGTMEFTQLTRNQVTYEFTNKNAKNDRTLIVEYPKLADYELKDLKPVDTTSNLYRFELKVPAGKKQAITIPQERTWTQGVDIFSYDTPTLVRWQQEGKVSAAVLEAVRKAGEKRAAIEAQNQVVQRLEGERNDIGQEQGRIRENMKSIDKASELYSRYMKKFGEQETRMEKLAEEIKAGRDKAAQLGREFADFVAGLNVE